MDMPPRQIQVNYIREIVKLMLWYMSRLASEQGVSFSVALTDYVDIYRKTSFFNLNDAAETERLKPLWAQCAGQLGVVFEDRLDRMEPSDVLEEEGLGVLWPSLAERIERGLPLVEYRVAAAFGCFYYHLNGTAVDLHFTNTLMPASPLKDFLGRAGELYELVRHCRLTHPEAVEIKCGTWLNEFLPFRRLFPADWKDTGEQKMYNSLGWWGQFVNHEGGINRRKAAQFRATGSFPYQCTFHQCEIKSLEDHLSRIL